VAFVAAALAVFAIYFLKKLILRVENLEVARENRFALPVEHATPTPALEVPTAMDVVGAWALEEEKAGRSVSDEIMTLQRRMRLEAGL
jgi:predicted cobalt transporter CbtA